MQRAYVFPLVCLIVLDRLLCPRGSADLSRGRKQIANTGSRGLERGDRATLLKAGREFHIVLHSCIVVVCPRLSLSFSASQVWWVFFLERCNSLNVRCLRFQKLNIVIK